MLAVPSGGAVHECERGVVDTDLVGLIEEALVGRAFHLGADLLLFELVAVVSGRNPMLDYEGVVHVVQLGAELGSLRLACPSRRLY